MDNYDLRLNEQFGGLEIKLKHFVNGATDESMCAKVIVYGLTKEMLKDKGSTALDLGNYLYRRFGLNYFHIPEYHTQDQPKNSLCFYIRKLDMARMKHVQEWLVNVHNSIVTNEEHPLFERWKPTKLWSSALYNMSYFTIPNDKEAHNE